MTGFSKRSLMDRISPKKKYIGDVDKWDNIDGALAILNTCLKEIHNSKK